MAMTKLKRRLRIKRRIRTKIRGTQERPRMSVFRSNKQIYVQFVNDDLGQTLASASSKDKFVVDKGAMTKGIVTVVFDRNGYLYHGRVKALAEAAREGGLNF